MEELDNQFEYWNSVSSLKSFTHPIDKDRFVTRVSNQADILDFGCGYGRICDELYQMGFKSIAGLDSSQLMIERGRQKYPHLNLQVLHSNSIPYQSDSFDAILLFAVLTCIPTNEGQTALMQEIHRTLRPGGIVYISDYWLQSDNRNLKRYDEYKDKYGVYGIFELPEGAIVRHHDRRWIASLCIDFITEDLSDIKVKTMNGNSSNGFQYIGRKKNNCNGLS